MKKLWLIILMAAIVSACGMINKKNLGLERKAPQAVADEKEKLVVPPNYNLRPQEPAAGQNAETVEQGL